MCVPNSDAYPFRLSLQPCSRLSQWARRRSQRPRTPRARRPGSGLPQSLASRSSEATPGIFRRLLSIVERIIPEHLRDPDTIIAQDAIPALFHYQTMLFEVAPVRERLLVAPEG